MELQFDKERGKFSVEAAGREWTLRDEFIANLRLAEIRYTVDPDAVHDVTLVCHFDCDVHMDDFYTLNPIRFSGESRCFYIRRIKDDPQLLQTTRLSFEQRELLLNPSDYGDWFEQVLRQPQSSDQVFLNLQRGDHFWGLFCAGHDDDESGDTLKYAYVTSALPFDNVQKWPIQYRTLAGLNDAQTDNGLYRYVWVNPSVISLNKVLQPEP